jgi:hypothetical protein
MLRLNPYGFSLMGFVKAQMSSLLPLSFFPFGPSLQIPEV